MLEDRERGGIGQIGDVEAMLDVHGGGEVGLHEEPPQIARDQHRRIVECERILLELRERGREVRAGALILPREAVLAPHVGEARDGQWF